jgi:hypothetical protein
VFAHEKFYTLIVATARIAIAYGGVYVAIAKWLVAPAALQLIVIFVINQRSVFDCLSLSVPQFF